jgi:hypothetical protein
MSTYFGLTWEDVLLAFHGTIEDDFATNSKTGREVIENELALQKDFLLAMVDEAALGMLEGQIPPYAVSSTCQDTSGNRYINLLGEPDCINLFYREEKVSRYVEYPSQDLLGYENSACRYRDCEGEGIEGLEEFDDYTIVGDRILLGPSFDTDRELVISFTGDINLPSLARVLRDAVCCNLGYQLYNAGDQTWGAVTNFCEHYKRWSDLYTGKKKFIPPELRGLKFLRSPWSIGIFSVRTRRV